MNKFTCPLCNGKMISRLARATQRRFWGCASFPTCRGTRDTDGEAKKSSAQERWVERQEGLLPSEQLRDRSRHRWEENGPE